MNADYYSLNENLPREKLAVNFRLVLIFFCCVNDFFFKRWKIVSKAQTFYRAWMFFATLIFRMNSSFVATQTLHWLIFVLEPNERITEDSIWRTIYYAGFLLLHLFSA